MPKKKLVEIEKFIDHFAHDCQSPHDIAWVLYENADDLREILDGKTMDELYPDEDEKLGE